jgi:hypothetical protein
LTTSSRARAAAAGLAVPTHHTDWNIGPHDLKESTRDERSSRSARPNTTSS